MRHPFTHLREFEGHRGKCIRYSLNGGRTWQFALVIDQPIQRRGAQDGYDVACEVRGRSRSHQRFFFNKKILNDPTCIVEPATPAEVRGKKWAGNNRPFALSRR